MKKNADIIIFLNRLLYTGIISSMILFCFFDLHGVADVNWMHMAVLVISAVALSAVSLLSGRQRMYVAVLSLFVFLFLFVSIGAEKCFLYFAKVLELSSSKSIPSVIYEIVPEEMIYIELGRVFLLTVICYLMQLILEKHIILKILSADVIGGWLIYMRKAPKMGVVFFVLYVGMVVVEWVRPRWKKMKNGSVQAYILGILPFLILYIVLLYLMPMQEKPYEWQWAKNIYRRAENKITMYAENLWNTGDDYFNGASSGFSGESGLFSNVFKNDDQLMILKKRRQKDIPVYLTGKVFDSFNGREWENRRENLDANKNKLRYEGGSSTGELQRVPDVAETVYALLRYSGDLDVTYYRDMQMNVLYQHFHSDYLMAPSKTWKIECEDKKTEYYFHGDNIRFTQKAGYGTEYTVRFCRIDMERDELYRFLEWNQNEDTEIWNSVVKQYTGKDIPIEELYAYREMVTEQYLSPTVISPGTEEWLASVTAEAKTDVERLKYIESALSAMSYNTQPGELPETVTDESSFLDYFLLEKREGYCAHYATAFVLLARAEGFPARYVQGFCIPMVSGDETSVYSDMAHAWPEVYVEGKGWIPFEPTPGFAVNRYAAPAKKADDDAETIYTERPETGAQDNVSVSSNEMSEENVAEENMPEEQDRNRWKHYLIRIVWILLAGSILSFGTDWTLERHREKKRGIDEKYRLAVLHNIQILDMLGYRRESFETYHELLERIRQGNTNEDMLESADDAEDREEDDGKGVNEVPCGFIENYERYLYGTLEVNAEILNEVLAEKVLLLTRLKKYKKRTYLFCRMKLYIMRYR